MRGFQVVDATQLATAYAEAEYVVEHGGQTLRVQVGRPAADLEASLPATRYAFITAWNPASNPRSDRDNRLADARLVARIESFGLSRQPAWAQSPDGRWHEPGWLLLDTPNAQVLELAHEFCQAGVLDWARGEPVSLYMLASRPPRGAETGATRWVREDANA